MAAKPETNAVRRSDPSPNVLMDPVSFRIIDACSSAWHDELPAGAENPDEQGAHAEAPRTALNVPAGHGVQESVLAPPAE
jgi:hypothetical protein